MKFWAHSRRHFAGRFANPPKLSGGIAIEGNLEFNPTTGEIYSVGYPVRVIPVEGSLDVEGLFGLTGEFTGWFSDDSAYVPIKASLNVVLGNVTGELKEWSRHGWIPPR